MRLLQLSDPHLLADPAGRHRGRRPWRLLRHGLAEALAAAAPAGPVDLLLISGDLCQDESWMGYAQLRDLLLPLGLPLALLAGNHDHPQLLRAALGRWATPAPALLAVGEGLLLLLDSHRPGEVAGWLGPHQLDWLGRQLQATAGRPLVVAVHHPPLPIGSEGLDPIGLRDGAALLALLRECGDLRAVLFGHVHQHWQGALPGRPEVPLLGCPSTLCSFAAVQPCPLGRSGDPGGRLLTLGPGGELDHQLLRWRSPDPPSLNLECPA